MIIRVEHTDHFTVVRNQTLRDSRLSYKATGLLAYLLSLPDDSTLSREHLADAKNDGVRSVRSGLKELTDCGYIEHRTVQNEQGQWRTEATVYERPKTTRTDGTKRAVGRQPADGGKRATVRKNKEGTAHASPPSPPERPCKACADPAWTCWDHSTPEERARDLEKLRAEVLPEEPNSFEAAMRATRERSLREIAAKRAAGRTVADGEA